MSAGPMDLLSSLMRLSSWLWPVVMAMPALASLIVAVVCTLRRTHLAAAWLLCVSWGMFALLVTAELLLWEVGLPWGEWKIWASHLLNVAEMACEVGVLVALLLFRPGRGGHADHPDGSYADDDALGVMP